MGLFAKLREGLTKTRDSLMGRVDTLVKETRKIDEDFYEELEDILLMSDCGMKATTAIMDELRRRVSENKVKDADTAKQMLKDIMIEQMDIPRPPLRWPMVMLVVGVNGAGKTTTIGKLGKKFSGQGYQVSLIAADTFRAAAVEQLAVWGARNNLRVYSGEPGCDSAGLCYDGLKEAQKRGDDIVFIDTAGRLQNKKGLMDELQKIVRVVKKVIPEAPHKTLITIDASTGQNGLDQVKTFKELVDVNGVVVTKLDGSSKGGILIAVAAETGIPVYFVGVGEQAEDMDTFKAEEFAKGLLDL